MRRSSIRLFCPFLVGLALAAAAMPQEIQRVGGYWVQTVKATEDVRGVTALRVTAWGDITVQGGAPGLSYTLERRVRAGSREEAQRLLARIRVRAVRRRGQLHLRVDCPPAARFAPRLRVSVPADLAGLILQTGAGTIEARGLKGPLTAESGAGTIVVDEIRGGVEARTAGGDIRIGRVRGRLHGVSGGGNIEVARSEGEAWLETAGGEITVVEALGALHASTGGGNIRVRRAEASVMARTGGGLIEVGRAGGEVVAETAGGGISVDGAGAVKCQSGNGTIRVRGVSGAVRAATASGSILAELVPGVAFARSFLGATHGDITVLIPSELAVTVKAQSVPAGRRAGIVSDFPEIRVRRPVDSIFAPLFAEGVLNGGGPVLHVAAAGGTIYLRRAGRR